MSEIIKHAIVEGDRIQAIAQRYLEDADRWVEIVDLNGLDYPFIVDNYRDEDTPINVKAIGEVVVIPIEDDQDLLKNLKPYQIVEGLHNVLGEDIAIFNFDEVIDVSGTGQGEIEGNNRGDLSTVKGMNNLKQAIVLRFATPMGSLYHHPDYGTRVYEYIGQKDTHSNIQKLRIEAERTVRDDSRVADVTISEFEYGINGSILIEIEVEAIGIEEVINMGISLDKEGIIEWD